ncbi:MAG: hypothetical protein PUI48_08795 [Oscillospiraceae bacterium]|nr:hypothetical protein [Oscillospiraceae bacterium]MDY6207320.1 hypothetical protein [Oscillospiraceae bacterium]
MHLVIISGAARPKPKSNTAKIIEAFKSGFEEKGNTSEVWYLSDRKQWERAAKAFSENDNILIALPLYVENIPGILLEFLSDIPPKTSGKTRLSFIVQGGFPEGSQSRCCEKYLETLPEKLGCRYGGTLIKGDMFGLGLLDEKNRQKLLKPFTEMGRYFSEKRYFEKSVSDEFAAPEYMPEKQIKKFNRFGQKIQRLFMGSIAKKLGCKGKLDAKPYDFRRKL